MIAVTAIVSFLIGVLVGIRWVYHDLEVANKKWQDLIAPTEYQENPLEDEGLLNE